MAAGGAEEHFAKKLANNEKKIRDRAVNKLRAWIKSRPKDGPGFDEVDLLKIWKGLFYCMWMSDKPLIQEELASNLSQLVFSFRNERSAVLFIKTFFKTMEKEWHGIDRLRLDKFYLLIRFFVKETFNLLKKTGWEDRLVDEVSGIFQEEPLNPTSQAVPDGIRLHVVAVYLAELKSVIDDQVSSEVLQKLLDPLFHLAAHSNNKTVTTAVKKSLFEHLVQNDTKETDEVQGTFINQVDFAVAADRLFTLASDREILGRNRNQLFEWAKRLKKCLKEEHKDGQHVQEGESLNGILERSKKKTALCESSEITTATTEDDNADAQEGHTREEKGKRKKKKPVEMESGHENGSCGNDVRENEKKEKKRKRKSKEQNFGNNVSSGDKEVTVDEEVKDEPKKKKKKKIVSDKIKKSTISKKHAKCDESNIEESVIVNGSSNKKDVPRENESLLNGSGINSAFLVNGDTAGTLEYSEHASSTVEKKALRKATSPNSEPFAKFQKNSTPPAFVRKCVLKTPRTEPPRSKKSHVKDQTPGSVPAKGTRKRVRIEMSKNTAHTTQDYQRSLKESPKIPFDAQKTPTQGLLKSPPLPRRTPLHVKKNASSTDCRQRQQNKSKTPQRPKAVDFF